MQAVEHRTSCTEQAVEHRTGCRTQSRLWNIKQTAQNRQQNIEHAVDHRTDCTEQAVENRLHRINCTEQTAEHTTGCTERGHAGLSSRMKINWRHWLLARSVAVAVRRLAVVS